MYSALIIWFLQSYSDYSSADSSREFPWWRIAVPVIAAIVAALSKLKNAGSQGTDTELVNFTGQEQGPRGTRKSSILGGPALQPRDIVPEVPSFDEALADAQAGLTPEQARSRRIMVAGQSIEAENKALLDLWQELARALTRLLDSQSPWKAELNEAEGWQLAGPLRVSGEAVDNPPIGHPPYELSAAEEAWKAELEGPAGPQILHQRALRELQSLQQARQLRGAALTLPGPLATVSQVLRHASEAVSPELQPASRARLRSLVGRFISLELPRICDNLRFGQGETGI